MTRRTGSGVALLADDTRRLIVGLVALCPRRPSELAKELGLSQPAISRQVALLARARLVRVVPSRVDRRCRLVELDPTTQGRVEAWLAGVDLRLEGALISKWARTMTSVNTGPPPGEASAKSEGVRG